MAKKARIVHGNRETIDFAPGVDNIVLRKDGVEFYNTETFHSSPFYDRTIPILIKSILESNDLLKIYGINGLRSLNEKVILINNHPIRKIKLVGRITECFIKEIKSEEFYFLTLDDSSGPDIVLKVSRASLLGAGLQPSNFVFKLIEITGYCSNFNGKLEVHPDFIQALPNNDKYIEHEVQFWKEALEMRDILKTPWFQTPQINEDEQVKIKFDSKTNREKLIRQRLDLGIDECPSQAMVMDSCIYMRNTRDRDDYSNALNDSGSEKEPEIEEITKKLFTKSLKKKIDRAVPFSPIARPQHGWVNVLSTPIKAGSLRTTLKFELIKWMIKTSREKFNLNEVFKDRKVSALLKEIANSKPTPTIEVDQDLSSIRTMNDIKGEIFHDERHDLQVWNLIKCTRSKDCYCAPILRLSSHIQMTLENFKFLSSQGSDNTSFNSGEYINNFNRDTGLKTFMDLHLLNILIQWCILRNGDHNWKYHSKTNEWQCISTFKRRRLVASSKRS